MRVLLVFIFFFTLGSSFAQNAPVKVIIDNIKTDDSNLKKRKFSIEYRIENLTDQPVTFFLTPNTLIANAASSMTLFPIYKIYQNGAFIELDGPFYEKENPEFEAIEAMDDYSSPEAQAFIKKYYEKMKAANELIIANYKKNGGENTDNHWILKNYDLIQSKITLQPKEIKTFTIKTYWNKKRYYNQDDIEYYLDEKDTFDFELVLDLKKTLFQAELSKEEFNQIKGDPNFIQGIFTSNKMKINFGE